MTGYLSLREVRKSYAGLVVAVDGVSLEVAKGEFVTFLGPSGSGKTTTLMMIAGFEHPDAGTISIGGRDIGPVPPHARNIGVVFQNYALFPHMTIAENVGFPLRMRKVAAAEARRRVEAALAMVGLAMRADRRPRELSGGQQQRVALARALVFQPDLLLLDEPLGALDKNLREQMQVEIRRIHRELGITTVYVTHDQTEAMTMSDRIAVFNNGRIEQAAPPLDVYFRPATRFVGGFVGDSNFLDAVVTDPRQGVLEAEGLGRLLGPAPIAAARGARVQALLRPEAIHIVAPGSEATYANGADFRIESIVNHGESVLLIGAAGPQRLRVRVSGLAAQGIREGERCLIGWDGPAMHLIAG